MTAGIAILLTATIAWAIMWYVNMMLSISRQRREIDKKIRNMKAGIKGPYFQFREELKKYANEHKN